jgi:hypothetical protein
MASQVMTLEALARKTDNFKEAMRELSELLSYGLGGFGDRKMFQQYESCLSPEDYAAINWWVQVDCSLLSDGMPPPWVKNRDERFSLW